MTISRTPVPVYSNGSPGGGRSVQNTQTVPFTSSDVCIRLPPYNEELENKVVAQVADQGQPATAPL